MVNHHPRGGFSKVWAFSYPCQGELLMKCVRSVVSILFAVVHICGAVYSSVDIPHQFGPDGQDIFVASLVNGNA